MARNKAWKRWKDTTKYISKLKKVLYHWRVDDKVPKNWKELDETNKAKYLKKTVIKHIYPWKKMYQHNSIKKMRNQGKSIINNELKEN